MDLLAERCARVAAGRRRWSAAARASTTRQLDERVNRLAWLLRHRGIGPEQTVALAIPRSIDAVVALFAVLRAGAAYLPLELDYPDERLAVMLDDAGPVCVLTTTAVAPRIAGAARRPARSIVLDDDGVARRAGRRRRRDWDGYRAGARRTRPTSSTPPGRPASPRASSPRTAA